MAQRRRTAAVLGTLVLMAALAQAQEITTVLNLNRTSRAPGSYPSAEYTFAATDSYPDTYEVRLNLDINATDFVNPDKSLTYSLYWRDPANGTWRLMVQGSWYGGPNAEHSSFAKPITELRGRTVRIELSVPSPIRAGASFDIGPAQ